MSRYYPMKPVKIKVTKDGVDFLLSLILALLIFLLAFMMTGIGLAIVGYGPEIGMVLAAKIAAFFGIGTLVFTNFSHYPKKVKEHFAYKKSMKEYNRTISEIDLKAERSDSEAFIKILKTGKVTRRSF